MFVSLLDIAKQIIYVVDGDMIYSSTTSVLTTSRCLLQNIFCEVVKINRSMRKIRSKIESKAKFKLLQKTVVHKLGVREQITSKRETYTEENS